MGKLRAPRSARGRVMAAAGMVMVGSLGIQTSSSLSASLFSALGPIPVSSMRMLVARSSCSRSSVCFGLYTLFADRVGKTGTGLDGLALSVTVAALATSPVSISHAPHMSAAQWGIIAASAVLGVAIPYTMDTLSGRITSARVVGTLFSIDPAMSVIIAALILRQTITAVAVIGVIVVSLAGAAGVVIRRRCRKRMILVIRLLDMAGLRMHVLPAAIDWNASLQLPVGLFGVGLEGADVCFDDGLVAVEAESRVIGCDGVAGGDVDGVRVEGDADGVPFARMACLAMFAYSSASRFDSRPASSRMVSGVSGRCGSRAGCRR